MTIKHDPKAPLRNKVCGWCDAPLEKARKGICYALFDREACFWVPTLRMYAPSLALRMGREASSIEGEPT